MNLAFEQALPLAIAASKELRPTKPNDRQLIARAAVLAVTRFSEAWWQVSLGGVTKCETRNRMGKFLTCCRDHATRIEQADFDSAADQVRIPRSFYARMSADLAIGPPKAAQVELKRSWSPPRNPNNDGAMNGRRNEVAQQLAAIMRAEAN
ncbi:MAG: hypothetical protein WBD31_02780 [Rubripirellula sp.]